MISFLEGKIEAKRQSYVVLNVNGIGFKIFVTSKVSRNLSKIGTKIKVFCATILTRENIELYGFLNQEDLEIFEMLNSISGVGPKAALKILNEMRVDSLLSIIKAGKAEVLTRAAGVGIKKANRIILELADQIKKHKFKNMIDDVQMEFDFSLEEILKSLGYKQNQIREAIRRIPIKAQTLQEKIKSALKILSGK